MELYTRKQTADILGVKPRTIRFYERQNIIKPAMYIKGRPRYSLTDIQNIPTENNKVTNE